MTRPEAIELLYEFTKSESLRKHALAVEACVAAYAAKLQQGGEKFGGPERVRTDDLFHAMEARSQLRHRPT